MKVRFWGVRGSLPVPGATTVRYGGNTSCVEVTSLSGTRVVVDAGTGLRALGKDLARAPFDGGSGSDGGRAHILISHTHWDHIQGLPYFAPLYQAGNHLHIYARRRDDLKLRNVLANQTEAPYFPVPFDDTRAQVAFHELADAAAFEIADVRVTTARLNHPYTATAYGLVTDGRKVVYVSDTAPFEKILFGEEFIARPPPPEFVLPAADREKLQAMRSDLVRLCEGADLVIYDTMFTDADYDRFTHFGHSRPIDALDVCRDAGAARMALYHHAPERADEAIDEMLNATRALAATVAPALVVLAAYEGLELDLEGA